MGLLDTLTTLTKVPMLLKVKRELALRPKETLDCLAARVEDLADRFPTNTAIIFEGSTLTWQQLNARANQFAHALAESGIGRGDTVSELGAVGALINTNLRGRPLVHCVTVANSKKFVFGGELSAALEEAKSELPLKEGSDYIHVKDSASPTATPNWAIDMDAMTENQSEENPASTKQNTLGDNFSL